jgi:DNA-binding TFAR19-related protein (PDSD5 family)
MSDDMLPLWKQKRLLEMQRKLLDREIAREAPHPQEKKQASSEEKLRALFSGRADEIYKIALSQFPQATQKLTDALAKMIDKGELTGPISGEELFSFFRMIGMRIRLETKISYVEHGKIKSIAEKMRQE